MRSQHSVFRDINRRNRDLAQVPQLMLGWLPFGPVLSYVQGTGKQFTLTLFLLSIARSICFSACGCSPTAGELVPSFCGRWENLLGTALSQEGTIQGKCSASGTHFWAVFPGVSQRIPSRTELGVPLCMWPPLTHLLLVSWGCHRKGTMGCVG